MFLELVSLSESCFVSFQSRANSYVDEKGLSKRKKKHKNSMNISTIFVLEFTEKYGAFKNDFDMDYKTAELDSF